MYFKDSQVLFLHPTKTGGTTVEQYLMTNLKDSAVPDTYGKLQYLNECGPDEFLEFKKQILFGDYGDAHFPPFSLQHACIFTVRRLLGGDRFDRAKKIAIVRDPYIRMVSLFFYFHFHLRTTFRDFVRDELEGYFRQSSEIASNFAARQTLYTHQNGTRVVDLILRQESMETSIAQLSDFLRLPIAYDPTVRMRMSEASSTYRNYMDAYDDESMRVVRELYWEDFELLGYQ